MFGMDDLCYRLYSILRTEEKYMGNKSYQEMIELRNNVDLSTYYKYMITHMNMREIKEITDLINKINEKTVICKSYLRILVNMKISEIIIIKDILRIIMNSVDELLKLRDDIIKMDNIGKIDNTVVKFIKTDINQYTDLMYDTQHYIETFDGFINRKINFKIII